MGAKEGVHHNKRQRGYGARDKEELIKLIFNLHNKKIYQYGDIKLDRKHDTFSSLMR